MFLTHLVITGFKSFAEKTDLTFLSPTTDSKGITAIVGPNGSGKSNVADALRWALGEQSIKLLRGKKSEDVIFSGSERRGRSGFADVTLTFNNEDGTLPIGGAEVSLTRRIYRDGESEYLINKNAVRLGDIQLLLAEAQIGARSYSVIGQGMIDHVLVSSPQERKEFFDEAAGVKQFQIKRHHTMNKLEASKENLRQAELLLAEIEPRLRSLSRQTKRLEERDELEGELHGLRHSYYGSLWSTLADQVEKKRIITSDLDEQYRTKESDIENIRSEFAVMAKQEAPTTSTGSDEFTALQKTYEKLLEEKNDVRSREMSLRSAQEVARQVRVQTTTTLPLSKIIEKISDVSNRQEKILKKFRDAKNIKDVAAIIVELESLQLDTKKLRDQLEHPTTSELTKEDPTTTQQLLDITTALSALSARLADVQKQIQTYHSREQQKKSEFFKKQHELEEKTASLHQLEQHLNNEKIELARLETRRESLEQEMTTELGEHLERAKTANAQPLSESAESVANRIQKIKYQLQLIGSIDPETIREYEETKTRFEYLQSQTTDLSSAIRNLENIISELDLTIKARSESAFRNLNREFSRYFKILFDGGHAELIQMTSEKISEENADAQDVEQQTTTYTNGIDIQATPPGKKIKNIAMLSGGERALISIALICAIMTTNPSPFVVLDEVDAALDESNADKFSAIIEELAHTTQFIVITHNRYTMRRANVLYGVSMRDDSTSVLLSINLDEVGNIRNTKEKLAV